MYGWDNLAIAADPPRGLVYDINSFEQIETFNYGQSKEGWGLCNDGDKFYKSDGTEYIWLLNANTLAEEGYIQAYTNNGKLTNLNELEWVEGFIYANRYQKNGVAIINPTNGAIDPVTCAAIQALTSACKNSLLALRSLRAFKNPASYSVGSVNTIAGTVPPFIIVFIIATLLFTDGSKILSCES